MNNFQLRESRHKIYSNGLSKKTGLLLFLVITIFFLSSICSSNDKVTNKISRDVIELTKNRQRGDKFSPTLRKAWEEYKTGNNPASQKLFATVLNSKTANDAEKVQALFGLGINSSYALHAQPQKAKTHFKRIATEYPQNPATPWALIELAYLQGSDTIEQRKSARTLYEQVLEEYQASPAIYEAALRLASMYFYEIEPDINSKAKDVLEKHLKKYPDNPLASIMRFRLAYWYEEVDRDYKKGLEHALILGELKMADPYRWPMQYWNVAQMYRIKFNKPEEAIKWYQKIIDEAPRDYLVHAAKKFVEELSSQLEQNE